MTSPCTGSWRPVLDLSGTNAESRAEGHATQVYAGHESSVCHQVKDSEFQPGEHSGVGNTSSGDHSHDRGNNTRTLQT